MAMRKLELGHGTARWWALGALVLAACVSSREPSGLGGESHFLSRCKDSCGMGLDCIQGVCTRGCVVGKQSCGDLADDAVCTSGSVEPGEVAVCDVDCSSDGDCAGLSAKHHCEGGFCRAAAVVTSTPGADAGSSSGDGGVSGPPFPSDKTFICPRDVATDPVTVQRSVIVGNELLLDLEYGGGCAKHDISVCFGPSFLESYPVQTSLRVIHDDHGDTCEALLHSQHKIDLTPLAQTYKDGYQTNAGMISTNFGLYGFGTLMCEERTRTADAQLKSFQEQADRACTTSADCTRVTTNTRCVACILAVVSNAGAEELKSWLSVLDEEVCRDYQGDNCPALPVPRCATTKTLACVAGECTEE